MLNARMITLQAISPLHVGVGQGVETIDLPIAREVATGFPYIPGSSVKGVLRDACKDRSLREKIFGPDKNNAHEHAGSVQLTDMKLLLFPVRSWQGIFAWVTSPLLLNRWLRDLHAVLSEKEKLHIPSVPSIKHLEEARIGFQLDENLESARSIVFVKTAESSSSQTPLILLEELDLRVQYDETVQRWGEMLRHLLFRYDDYWKDRFMLHFAVVHDEVMGYLLTSATEVTARVRLKEDIKTVADGALWYEEALPAETVLYGLAVATPVKAEVKEVFETISGLVKTPLQIGGKATVGRGMSLLSMIESDLWASIVMTEGR